jgi:hypothetical protein
LEHYKTAYADLDDRKAHEIEILSKELDDANIRERELRSKLEMQD